MCKNNNVDIKCKYCGELNKNQLDAIFCIYCGKPLVNQCINNQCDVTILDEKAAFCHKCGEPSLFNDYSVVAPKFIQNDDFPF